MALKSIAQEWEGFAAMVFDGVKLLPHQREEMQRAFFAGAWAMFNAIEEIGTPQVSEVEAHRYLESIRRECQEFKAELMARYAEGN